MLCEKPCAPNAADLAEMLDACREHNVQFMDGVMFMHSGRLPLMRRALDDGQSVGRIQRIASQFSFLGGDDFLQQNIRVSERTRTARLPGRPRLVQHPLHAVGDELPNAAST